MIKKVSFDKIYLSNPPLPLHGIIITTDISDILRDCFYGHYVEMWDIFRTINEDDDDEIVKFRISVSILNFIPYLEDKSTT